MPRRLFDGESRTGRRRQKDDQRPGSNGSPAPALQDKTRSWRLELPAPLVPNTHLSPRCAYASDLRRRFKMSKKPCKLTPILGALAAIALTSPGAQAVQEVVHLRNIEQPLVPIRVLEGDREFGGNGPDIVTRLTLEVDPSRTQVLANVFFRARETKPDWSTTEATWRVPVFHTMPGQTINGIADESASSVSFRSKKPEVGCNVAIACYPLALGHDCPEPPPFASRVNRG